MKRATPITLPLLHAMLLAMVLGPAARAEDAGSRVGKPVTFPFEITSNKPFVQVRVNGSEPQWFVLDTGCRGASIVSRECADRLGLARGAESATRMGAGQGVSVALSQSGPVVLDVAGDTLRSPSLFVIPFDHINPYEGRAIQGLLGEDYLRRHVVELDYAHQVIRAWDPASYRYTGETPPIPLTFDRGLAVADAEMTAPGRPATACRLVIDTGVRTTVVWYHPFVIAQKLLETQRQTFAGTIGGGAGGETRGDIGRLDWLRVGTLLLRAPTVVFSRDTSGVFAGHEEDGILGGEILRRCKVTFDYPHKRLMLEPYEDVSADFDFDMSGLFLVAPGPDFRRVLVQSVSDGTPAAAAGIRKDDEIVSVDRRSTSGMKLDEVRELFRSPGRAHQLELKRGADSLSVTFTTRRLV